MVCRRASVRFRPDLLRDLGHCGKNLRKRDPAIKHPRRSKLCCPGIRIRKSRSVTAVWPTPAYEVALVHKLARCHSDSHITGQVGVRRLLPVWKPVPRHSCRASRLHARNPWSLIGEHLGGIPSSRLQELYWVYTEKDPARPRLPWRGISYGPATSSGIRGFAVW